MCKEIKQIDFSFSIITWFHFRLVYTEAFILETARCGSIIPLSVPHRAKERFDIKGKIIDSIPNFKLFFKL